MRAAVDRRFGDPEVVRIEEVTKAAPARDGVLIRVYASTVNAADYRARTRIAPKGLAWVINLSVAELVIRRRARGRTGSKAEVTA